MISANLTSKLLKKKKSLWGSGAQCGTRVRNMIDCGAMRNFHKKLFITLLCSEQLNQKWKIVTLQRGQRQLSKLHNILFFNWLRIIFQGNSLLSYQFCPVFLNTSIFFQNPAFAYHFQTSVSPLLSRPLSSA